MCHLILLMPVIGLIVFWIWPLSTALPVYLVILSLTGLVYFALTRAMHRPVVTGKEGLIGKSVDVIDMSGHSGHVRFQGEIWQAFSEDSLQKGNKATIVGVKGLTLRIGKEPDLSKQAPVLR